VGKGVTATLFRKIIVLKTWLTRLRVDKTVISRVDLGLVGRKEPISSLHSLGLSSVLLGAQGGFGVVPVLFGALICFLFVSRILRAKGRPSLLVSRSKFGFGSGAKARVFRVRSPISRVRVVTIVFAVLVRVTGVDRLGVVRVVQVLRTGIVGARAVGRWVVVIVVDLIVVNGWAGPGAVSLLPVFHNLNAIFEFRIHEFVS